MDKDEVDRLAWLEDKIREKKEQRLRNIEARLDRIEERLGEDESPPNHQEL